MKSCRWNIDRDDAAYPECLKELGSHAPKTLYGIGDPDVLSRPSLSIIGARRATPYGVAIASMAGRICAESGVCVVSGGALGCDASASRGALGAGGPTIIVSGLGADLTYPQQSADVFDRARAGEGAVISERPWGSQPAKWAFRQRNRMIAALSPSLLVTEAGERSGTASTAEVAVGLGRQVYAIPGSIFSPSSAFTNRLISEGASIICNEQDLELRLSMDYGCMRMLSPDDGYRGGRVLSALFAQPMRPDDLAQSLGENVLTLLKTLSDYEMDGIVERLPDGRMSLTREAYETHARMGGRARQKDKVEGT